MDDLRLEIEILKQRVERLEQIENRRRISSLIKTFIVIITLVFIGLEFYKYYQKVAEFVNQFNKLF
ncbi:MAG: hypothetical protein MR266_04545 [Erysipelotrichaceae bacterium]|nr:hypothetical protein [Erysipelotrichaceae bacterium]